MIDLPRASNTLAPSLLAVENIDNSELLSHSRIYGNTSTENTYLRRGWGVRLQLYKQESPLGPIPFAKGSLLVGNKEKEQSWNSLEGLMKNLIQLGRINGKREYINED